MFPKDEFKKYATQHLGMSTMHLEKYMAASVPNITGFTPQVIEERQMNIVGMDVFSRLMMDRIRFARCGYYLYGPGCINGCCIIGGRQKGKTNCPSAQQNHDPPAFWRNAGTVYRYGDIV